MTFAPKHLSEFQPSEKGKSAFLWPALERVITRILLEWPPIVMLFTK